MSKNQSSVMNVSYDVILYFDFNFYPEREDVCLPAWVSYLKNKAYFFLLFLTFVGFLQRAMRAGWTTIQQTLTTEAVDVLNQSIAEAARRSHAQTTPLHVAATLLVSPTGCLRQACVRSQSNSSHPLQCRALELCFSVALDRLPSRKQTGRTVSVPPISNALMAALKRAQANQRKGCTEQMQQHLPMMAVKVEVEQLIVSILDDPSVCRVMEEARFSSPTVKSVIEQSNVSVSPCSSSSPTSSAVSSPITSFFSSAVGLGFQKSTTPLPTKKTFYINPRLLSPEQTWTPSIPPTKLSRGNGIGILSSSVESLLSSRTTDPSRETSCRPGQKTLVRKPPQPVLSSSKTRFFHSNDVPMTTVQKPYYSPPVSLVETDLALGRSAKENHENHIKDQSECTDDFFFFSGQQLEKSSGDFDSESFKKLFKGLTEKISWQPEAASAVAITVTRFKSGPGISALRKKSDTWILFLGPDKVGKKKMASSLSELLFGNDPTTVTLGGTEIRKRTALDRIAEAVWRNPFSVFVIENVDQADTLIRFKIKQAIESGRIMDSNGREVSLGSAIFILTADSSPSAAASLESVVRENTKKRHRSESLSSDVSGKGKSRTVLQEPKLTLDLHLGNPSGDPTVENVNEDRYGLLMMKRSSSTLPMDMIRAVDDVINFKAVDLGSLLARSPSPVKDGIRSH